MIAGDAEYLEHYTRICHGRAGSALQVATISWDSQEPVTRWRTVLRWPRRPSPATALRARRRALENRRFFVVCPGCRRRAAVGQMMGWHRGSECHGCAAQVGVVF